MKQTTIAMIIIAVAGLICGIAALLSTLAMAEKINRVDVVAKGKTTFENLPGFKTLSFENCGEIVFNDSFPGIKIVVDPQVTQPTVSAPEEVMTFINHEMDGDLLKLYLHPDSTIYPSVAKRHSFYEITASSPITVTVGSLPEMIDNNCNLSITLAGNHMTPDTVRINTPRALNVADCSLANLEVSGDRSGYFSSISLNLTGNSHINSLHTTRLRNITLTTDSTASIASMLWTGIKDYSHKLRITEANIGKFEFIPAKNSDIAIISSANLSASFAAN